MVILKRRLVFRFMITMIRLLKPISKYYKNLTSKVFLSSQAASPVISSLVSKAAPRFKATAVIEDQLKDISLDDYKGKHVVLLFYPLNFTFVCPTEIIAFSKRSDEFTKLDVQVLCISVDSPYCHLAWINTPKDKGGLGPINIPLVSDMSRKISKDYGILLDTGFALRALFLLDSEHIIRHLTINDAPIGRSVNECLRIIQAVQYHKQHGNACPIDWEPGAPTIKPDPVGSKEYFEKQK